MYVHLTPVPGPTSTLFPRHLPPACHEEGAVRQHLMDHLSHLRDQLLRSKETTIQCTRALPSSRFLRGVPLAPVDVSPP